MKDDSLIMAIDTVDMTSDRSPAYVNAIGDPMFMIDDLIVSLMIVQKIIAILMHA